MTQPMDLTQRQYEVLEIVKQFPKGVSARQVRDRIYPEDSPMRTKRTSGRGASSFNGSIGATGNLAAGRILAALERKGYVHRGREYDGEQDNRFYLGRI